MQRLQAVLTGSAPKVQLDAYQYLALQQFISPEEEKFRLSLRQALERDIAPTINQYVQRAQFPTPLIPKIKALKIIDRWASAPYGNPMSIKGIGTSIAQLARVDAGVATFLLVQWGLVISTIELLGSEEQKKKYIPALRDLEVIGGWGLTQPQIGSDASSLTTQSQERGEEFILNGKKRWIGNGNREILVSWSRNKGTKQIEGYIIETKDNGVKAEPIKGKLPLRIVQNCEITLTNTRVPKANRLPKATNFQTGTAVVLKHSRLFVCWVAAGIALGVYDNAIKYTSQRKQFGKPTSSYQLVQQKLVRILSNTQAIWLTSVRISQLAEKNQLTLGQVAMAKAFTSERLREVAKLGRQVMGGNGILIQNYVMKGMADAEAIYTYQGTYDMNSLVAGREITGLAAFKSK